MLKALELAGFKSFADRTRFDFPDGITVVVGPNGSGKSNIVDAMKWVLGSQSAKALRGKDMADVIFKGSQTRGPSGSAEVTIIFDNPDGVLPVDAPEVHITRRVYRSGESEYLINKEAVRLKDIRNLIRGTGIGIDAYSLIEQGKVDRMLQANAKDRRAIFEEAAGISRFKAKKTEAERRLTRVQSNLTRLGDIVDEVGSRLRSIRAQASKAEKYRQTSHRLKLLRVHSAHFDWSNLSAELADLERERATAAEQMETLESQRSESRELRRVADAKLSGLDEKLRQIQSRQNDNAREVAVLEARLQSNRKTREENKTPLASTLNRVRVLRSQQQLADQAMADELRRHEKYKVELDDILRRADEVHEETSRLESEASQLRLTRDQQAQNHISTVRELSKLKDDRQSRVASLETKSADLRRAESLSEQLNISLQEAHQLSKQTNSSVESLQHRRQDTQRELDKQVAKIAEVERTLSRRREEESALLLKIQTLQERRRVLEELQRRREGISGGVQEVLEALEQGSTESESPPSHSIEEVRQSCRGIVADAIEADVKVAPLIDAALGERSQYLVVRGDALQQAIIQKNIRLEQRVGLIRLDELPPRRPGDRIRLDGLKGVLGRGDRLVKCDPAVEDLVRHLLCNTWLVDSLETAYGLRRLSGAGLRFVTTDGHLLENDGSLVIGSAASAAGLVSRQSELQAAIQEADHYQYQLESASEETKALAERLDDYIATRGQHEQHLREIATNLATAVAEQRHAVERLERCQSEKTHNQQIIHDVQQVLQTIGHQKSALDGQIAETAKTAEQYEAETASLDEQLSEVTTVLEQSTSLRMSLSVDLAKAEQKFEAASDKLSSHHAQQAEREARLTETRLEADAITSRQREAQLEWLIANEKHAKCINRNEVLASEYASHARDASTIRRDNEAILNRDDELIQKTATASKQLSKIDASKDQKSLRLENLVQRIREDYELELQDFDPDSDGEEGILILESIESNRAEIDNEIETLRVQAQRSSNVNMEALEELEELQSRYDELHGHYQDLTAAKENLQRIIGKINADSRRLFTETLEAIRENFTELYRRSFGGGQADLVLEDSEDPLEAGVEIVATPPGKPSFNNSLLSGGEKALTAVALLLSIFKYRPSPFCVLDEVDAPFDEANIGRFVTVLNQFLDHSKFVVVTHSKKTMTAATTLYGVTMQESGVSKRVSIRFEDVSDDGEITDTEAA